MTREQAQLHRKTLRGSNDIAIKAIQNMIGVTADGDAGPATWEAFEDAAAKAYGVNVDRSLHLPKAQYFPGTYEKDLIVMHHTAGGSPRSSLNGWIADKTRVGTAYFVDRDGTVYEVFPPDGAAGNLGLGGRQETRSIGIEICNWGWLKKQADGRFAAWPGLDAKRPTTFIPEEKVHTASWRGDRYWEKYTEAAIVASINLADYLCDRFGIDRDVAPPEREATNFERFKNFKGVIAHYHVRRDKTDVSPAYPWHRLTEKIETK